MATKLELPKLPFEYDALEPVISKETLTVHHDKHHQAYCDKFNAALEAEGIEDDVMEIFSKVSSYSPAIRNNGGGFWNHCFYWNSLTAPGQDANGKILELIKRDFGSLDKFKEEFTTKATTLFGSGWTWLGITSEGKLIIHNTPNQDNTHMDIVDEKYEPLLVIDVWEHAYYIDYQNRRPEHIGKFFSIINWEKVNERLADTLE